MINGVCCQAFLHRKKDTQKRVIKSVFYMIGPFYALCYKVIFKLRRKASIEDLK
ncbi:hypothetical protein ALTERO38_51608 [Alteromonas sp. 38]|nr:hypothetical protein ALTER154_80153 [Alteromonas sp. 154]VXB80133.1 hypothetical protein ALTERO38_51608 [Alteromonas sp. 38]